METGNDRGSVGGEKPQSKASLARRTGIVAAGTMLSRLLGVVRDQVLAATVPLGWTDLFFDAFTIPNALRGLLAEGAVSSALVPVYSKVREDAGEAAARRFYASFRGGMIAILTVTSALGVLAARPIAFAYGGGFAADPFRFEVFVTLVRIVFPYIFFMGIAALGAGVLNANDRFAVPAAAPALLNLAFIAAPFVFVPVVEAMGQPAVLGLGVAVLVGGALQVLAQWPSLRAAGIPVRVSWNPGDPRVREAFRLLLPLTLGLGIYQLNVMLSRLFASYLPEGALSHLWYAQRLVEVPQGMFGVAIASAALPHLSALRARGDRAGVIHTLHDALSLALFVAIPMSAILVALARPIVTVLFSRGEFDSGAADETARSLVWQALGVTAVAAVRVLVPVFHAHGETRSPVLASAANLGVFAALAWTLSRTMGHAGIAAAISAAGLVQCLLLGVSLQRKLGALGLRKLAPSVLRVLAASTLAALAGRAVSSFGAWDRGGNDPGNLLVAVASLGTACAVFFALALSLGTPEARRLVLAVRARVRAR